jgi:2-hydroxy-3-keto-5-methylthiopentenyl-1-phosphate phosphatase
MAPPTTVVLDFDGTLTERDAGDALCARFAPPLWQEIDERWHRREIALPHAQRLMWGLVRGSRAELARAAREAGALRPGAGALLAACAERGWPVVLASGGFDFYLEPILGPHRRLLEAAYFNRAHPSRRGVRLEFPHPDLACGTCAVCKGRVLDRHRSPGRRLVFVGDGSSDRCALGRADLVFALAGGALDRDAAARGIACVRWRSLDQVREVLVAPSVACRTSAR